jgi:murein DD-endopeptidase MepM/ murein hydrolase activator NlpD
VKRAFLLPISLALAAYFLLPLPGQGAPLQKRIEKKRSQVEVKKRHEGVLTSDITGYNNRIRGLQGQISSTQHQLTGVQSDLDAKRAELLRVRGRLEVARDRLERLRSRLKVAEAALADRLVEIYKSDEPDALTVVLQADGFSDLLDRTEFLNRISDQDRTVTARVRVLKERSRRQAATLASLERREQVAAEAILRRRDQIAAAKTQLVNNQGRLRSVRNRRRTVLASVRDDRRHAEEDLAAMERAQQRIQSQLAGGGGPIRKGNGRFIWPVNGPITGQFGEQRPGHIHAGVDIAAGEGTPIHAAGAGTVALMGVVGGYGNYTCIQHGGGISTCYGHQSRFGTSQGAHVRQGQVIGFVGSTGHSTGAHLHFEVRVNGSPVNPLGYL